MNNKLQYLKVLTYLKFRGTISNQYDGMIYLRQKGNFMLKEDPFSKNTQRTATVEREGFLIVKFFQTKPQIKIITYYDLYYVITLNISDGREN